MAEGAPLLREYGLKTHRGFESLSLRQTKNPATGGVFCLTQRKSGLEPRRKRLKGSKKLQEQFFTSAASPEGEAQGWAE